MILLMFYIHPHIQAQHSHSNQNICQYFVFSCFVVVFCFVLFCFCAPIFVIANLRNCLTSNLEPKVHLSLYYIMGPIRMLFFFFFWYVKTFGCSVRFRFDRLFWGLRFSICVEKSRLSFLVA